MSESIVTFFSFLGFTWWLWLFLILFPITRLFWLFWRQSLYLAKIEWVLLELKMPLEVKKSAKAMEQVFMALRGLPGPPDNISEEYLDGYVVRWFSLEIVSFGGDVRLYIRTPVNLRNLVEAAFFSYYTDVELVEAEDYVDKVPKSYAELRSQNKKVWGAEIILDKDSTYPIKTYSQFESFGEIGGEKNLDPMSMFLEFFGKLNEQEFVGVQILITPQPSDWSRTVSNSIENLKRDKQSGTGGKLKVDFPGGGPLPRFGDSAETPDANKELVTALRQKTPGEVDLIKAMENKLSKPVLSALIRVMYVAPPDVFRWTYVFRGVRNAFNQYSGFNLNSFKYNSKSFSFTTYWYFPHMFVKLRSSYRMSRILRNYRRREKLPENFGYKAMTSHLFNLNFYNKASVLSVEELATIFHPPTSSVLTAPHIKRVESRKVGPPAGLAVFGSEEEFDALK